jgi:hypothetical protein
MLSAVYRNGSIWCAHQVFLPPAGNLTYTAIQWYQLGLNGEVQQIGRIEDPLGVTFYAYPSIAVNRNNDALIGYSRFSPSQYASANYAFRFANDPVGALRTDSVLKAGEASYGAGNPNRWGDYSNTVVDPVDDTAMWTIQEYAFIPFFVDRWGLWWGQISPSQTPCAFSINSTTQQFSADGGPGSLDIQTSTDNCSWTVSSVPEWITITSGSHTTGSATLNYRIAPNPVDAPRSTTLIVATKTFTITQEGSRGPKITSAVVEGKHLIVTGTNFDNGALLFMDGVKVKKTGNSETSPTTGLVARKAGKSIARGSTVVLSVQNNDGTKSNDFSFTRL